MASIPTAPPHHSTWLWQSAWVRQF